MKNCEKYKTPEERVEAYVSSTVLQSGSRNLLNDFANWLDSEAYEEQPLPCPYCGGNMLKSDPSRDGKIRLYCQNISCGYRAALGLPDEAIAKHNRVAHAVMEANGESV